MQVQVDYRTAQRKRVQKSYVLLYYRKGIIVNTFTVSATVRLLFSPERPLSRPLFAHHSHLNGPCLGHCSSIFLTWAASVLATVRPSFSPERPLLRPLFAHRSHLNSLCLGHCLSIVLTWTASVSATVRPSFSPEQPLSRPLFAHRSHLNGLCLGLLLAPQLLSLCPRPGGLVAGKVGPDHKK